MKICCPAKINLALELLGQRPDGFFEIRTIYQTVALADELEFRPVRGPGLRLAVQAEGMEVPAGEKNLVYRAYEAFQLAHGPAPGLSATLVKKIPPGSGLGGGSSDAAAMLLHLQRCCGRPDFSGLEALAAGLGSDVPFFLHGGTAMGSGRGEQVTPLADAHKHLVLLILPSKNLSTRKVYQACGRLLTSGTKRISIHRYLNEKGEVCPHRDIQRNDLETVVFRMEPELGRLKDLLYATGAGFASLTGSGSGLYGLFESKALAADAAGRFEALSCRAVLTRFLGRGACRALRE